MDIISEKYRTVAFGLSPVVAEYDVINNGYYTFGKQKHKHTFSRHTGTVKLSMQYFIRSVYTRLQHTTTKHVTCYL
jgi:hypothetical protein